jgi:hypothetical protein
MTRDLARDLINPRRLPRFTVTMTLAAPSEALVVNALKLVLKRLLRGYGVRCSAIGMEPRP